LKHKCGRYTGYPILRYQNNSHGTYIILYTGHDIKQRTSGKNNLQNIRMKYTKISNNKRYINCIYIYILQFLNNTCFDRY